MWIQLINGKLEETLEQLKQSADEKEASLEIMVGETRNHLMKDIVLFRKSYRLLQELYKMKEAYEELLEIRWNYTRKSSTEDIMGGK